MTCVITPDLATSIPTCRPIPSDSPVINLATSGVTIFSEGMRLLYIRSRAFISCFFNPDKLPQTVAICVSSLLCQTKPILTTVNPKKNTAVIMVIIF